MVSEAIDTFNLVLNWTVPLQKLKKRLKSFSPTKIKRGRFSPAPSLNYFSQNTSLHDFVFAIAIRG